MAGNFNTKGKRDTLMSLKDTLFPDTNITGFTDVHNQPILAGQKVQDELKEIWYIHSRNGEFVASQWEALDNCNAEYVSLNLFITLSHHVEIIK